MLNPTIISMPGGRAGTPGASYEKTRREQSSQEDREARLDRQRLRSNHLKRRQRWVPQPVSNNNNNCNDKHNAVIKFTVTSIERGKLKADLTSKFRSSISTISLTLGWLYKVILSSSLAAFWRRCRAAFPQRKGLRWRKGKYDEMAARENCCSAAVGIFSRY